MTPNAPLLLKVLEHITAHPEEHNQRNWGIRRTGCGTAYCFAGWAAVMSGHELLWEKAPFDDDVFRAFITAEGRPIESVAQDELGLTYVQQHEMFGTRNTLRQLWQMAAVYTRGEITPPPEFA